MVLTKVNDEAHRQISRLKTSCEQLSLRRQGRA